MGRAVTIDELVRVSTEDMDVVGVPTLERGCRPRPVMVICEGRILRVWISMPEIERMDSCDVERRREGWKGVHSSSRVPATRSDWFGMSEVVNSSSSDSGTVGAFKSWTSSISPSSSSWMTCGWKLLGATKLRVDTSEPRLRWRGGGNCGDPGSTLDPGDVGRDESRSKLLSNNALFRYIDCGELGTEEGVKSDI